MTESSNKQIWTQVLGPRLQLDVLMSRYTAARVGGPVDALFEAKTSTELAEAARLLWQLGTPFVILGGGSNVLVSDAGIRGVVLLNHARRMRFDEKGEPPQVWVESGVNFGVLARQAAQRGLGGLEWAAGIPGTVGGAIIGNAGAHGYDMASNLLMAEILHQNGQIENWSADRFGFAYRSSNLKSGHSFRDDGMGQGKLLATTRQTPPAVILSAVLGLERKSPAEVQERIDTYVTHRKRTQPPGASMGSMFKNPPGDYAGRLIEAAGLKNKRIGDVEISRLHGNFFINMGQARAADIYELIELAQRTVFDKFGVNLELEIELLGEW